MADEPIGIEANLNQPSQQMKELADRVNTVSKACQALIGQFKIIADSRVGAVTTKQFQEAEKELLKALNTTQQLIKNQDTGGRIGKMVMDGMVASIKANQTTFSRSINDAVLSALKDAERLMSQNNLVNLINSKNKGNAQFVTASQKELAAGQGLGEARRLELLERMRAAELLLAQAQANTLQNNTKGNQAVVDRYAKQVMQLTEINAKATEQVRLIKEQLATSEKLAAVENRRATLAAQKNIYGAARLSTADIIEQTTGLQRLADTEKRLGDMRAFYSKQQSAPTDRLAVEKANIAARMADKEHQDMVSKLQQQQQRNRMFGDGGSFLLEIQARLLLNYKVLQTFINALGYGVRSVVEFDDALHQLKAIAGASTGEMEKLKVVITDIASESRFTATEVTKAATVLAQAGLSTSQISKALDPITKLAVSTGSDLKTSVDVVSSVLGAFNYRAEETGQIVNIMAGALNNSKLDMEKLALGIQYSGNTAAQANLSFSELTAVISALANTGVRSGSTLGTGVTQLIADLLNPTDKLKKVLDQTGLTLADVDVRSRGFIAVLKTMAEAGFGTAQAFEGFELRGARAYLGLVNQTGALQGLQREIISNNAAYDGNRAAMESLAATSDKLQSNFGILADKMGSVFVKQVIAVLKAITSVVQLLGEMNGAVGQTILAIAGGAAFALLGTYLVRVAGALVDVVKGLITTQSAAIATKAGLIGVAEGAVVASAATRTLAVTLGLLRSFAIPLALFAAFELFASGVLTAKSASEKFREELDRLKQKSNEANQEVTKQVDAQAALDKAIVDLMSKYQALNSDSDSLATATLDLKRRFADLGLELPKTVTNVDQLVDALTRLKNLSRDQQLLDLGKKISAEQEKTEAYRRQFNTLRDTKAELDQYLIRDSNTGGAGNALRGSLLGGQDKVAVGDGSAANALRKSAGTIPEIMKLIDAFDSGVVENIIGARAELEKAVVELNKKKAAGVYRMTPGDTFPVEQQAKIAALLIERAGEAAQAGLGMENSSGSAANSSRDKILIEESRKAVYQIMEDIAAQGQKELALMRAQLQNAPNGEKRAIADKMMARAAEMTNAINAEFEKHVTGLTGEAEKLARDTFNRVGGGSNTAKQLTATTKGDRDAAMEEENKYEQALLMVKKNTILSEIKSLQKKLEISKEFDVVSAVNEEIARKGEELVDIQRSLNQKSLDVLSGRKNAGEREKMLQAQAEELAAMEQSNLDVRLGNTKKTAEIERARMDSASKSMEVALNATIQSQLASMQGLLGKAMPAEAKERIFQQISELLEQIATLQIKQLIRAIEISGGDPDDASNRAQFDAILTTKQETISRIRSQINNNIARGGSEELSRELQQMLADIAAGMKRMANTFKNIEKGLENANRAADTITQKFEYQQRAYDAPQNRDRYSSAFKEVDDFSKRFGVENNTRQLKIEALEKATAESERNRAASEANVMKLKELEQQYAKNASGSNQYSTALARIKQDLASAEGQVETYTNALEKQEIELGRLRMEQTLLNEKKPNPSAFEMVDAGVKKWIINNGLFRDSMAQLGEQIPNMLSAVSNGFATFLSDVTSGTKSVGEAFGDMAKNIINSLLQILNQMLAMMMVKMLMKSFGMGFNSGGPVGEVDSRTAGGMNMGGLIRQRRAGGGMSSIGTRDSVPILARPGEYVLRNSAVDMIGRGTLDQLNAQGNRTMDQTRSRMPSLNSGGSGGIDEVNVWIVPQGQQPPPPSKKDIIAVVSQDMASGGQTKQMVKKIQAGQI